MKFNFKVYFIDVMKFIANFYQIIYREYKNDSRTIIYFSFNVNFLVNLNIFLI